MGEVGTNSTDSPAIDTKMNGSLNGNNEGEPMEVDSQPDDDNKTENDPLKAESLAGKEPADNVDSTKSPITTSTENNSKEVDKQNGDADADNQPSPKDNINVVELTKIDSEISITGAVKNGDSLLKVNNGLNSSSSNKSNSGSDEVESRATIDKVDQFESEIHSISDSDDDRDADVDDAATNLSKTHNNDKALELTVKRNNGTGLDKNRKINDKDDYDDDKPVSIHSDTDEDDVPSSSLSAGAISRKNGGSSIDSSTDVQEVLSDKEDCVVIEDDGNDMPSDSQRSANNNRARLGRPREYTNFDDDIEEIIEDPLHQPISKKPRMSEPTGPLMMSEPRNLTDPLGGSQSFVHANNKGNEPTMMIIDTNDILARGPNASHLNSLQKQNVSVVPMGIGGNVYPMDASATITPLNSNQPIIRPSSAIPIALPSSIDTDLLPALSDDMFVLEAPSFIVPYIYEKPPAESLRTIVDKMSIELAEQKEKEEKEKEEKAKGGKEEAAEEKKSEVKGTKDGETDAAADDDDAKEDDDKKDGKRDRGKRKPAKSGDESWDESDESTDDDASDSEERTKVLIKEAKHDLTSIINSPVSAFSNDPDKKDLNNYFESPLGTFFMDIGINLVQEYVQTDLLRQQKRKLHREGAQASPETQMAINALMKNLETSKQQNEVFKFPRKRCEFCTFKSESILAIAHHYETPHMKNNLYSCNFCVFGVKAPYDILFHMKNEHHIQARLEKALSYHQCPNCAFEDNGKSKLARHQVVCAKKFKPETNLSPPFDWEPPAKIPRIKPRHGLVGTANTYQVCLNSK